VLDLWVGYARRSVDSRVAVLSSDYDIDRLFVSANATGRLVRGDYEIRPKLELFYSNDDADAHSYSVDSGGVLPPGFRVDVDGGSDDLFISTLSGEVRRGFLLASGTRIEPFGRVGIQALLTQPNDGQLINGDFDYAEVDPVTGQLLGGVGVAFASGGRLDARVLWEGIGGDFDALGAEIGLSLPF
jgi:hypothetical protein